MITDLPQPSSVPYPASVGRYELPGEKRRVGFKPAGQELGEEPHALGLARLPLSEKPNRSIELQVGIRSISLRIIPVRSWAE